MKKIILSLLLIVLTLNFVNADVKLDGVSFDPSIIAVGDEVTITVNFHEELSKVNNLESEYANRGDITLKATLIPKNTLAKNYITIINNEGYDIGHLFIGDVWRQKFKVKVNNNAPVGDYEFYILFQYYKDGVPLDVSKKEDFVMEVTKEGIVIDVANLNTEPNVVRSGDDYVNLKTYIENSGEKDAKSIETTLELPEGFEPSYGNNNRVWLGYLKAGSTKSVDYFIDLKDNLKSGTYNLTLNINYRDLDNNENNKTITIPLYVKPKPIIEVVSYEGSGLAGDKGTLIVKVKNTGEEEAESVDVRLVKESLQPFELEVRSDYVGTLKPGEEGTAVFKFDILREANIKDYNFKLLIRAKGDTEEGDDNIYTFERKADFSVMGVSENKIKIYGLYGALILVILFLLNILVKGFSEKSKKKKNK